MPFIPDSAFGIIYALCCFGASLLAFKAGDSRTMMVATVMMLHWFIMRGISSTVPDVALAWVIHDFVTVLALICIGKAASSRLAFSCAALFFVVMLFDQAWWLSIGSFEQNAAVAEAAGYLCFLMIAGASLGHNGRGSADTSGSFYRRAADLFGMEGGRSISGRAEVFGAVVATNQDSQKTNSRTA